MPHRSGRVAIACVLSFLVSGWENQAAAADADWGLAQLMAELHAAKSASATFVEHRRLHLLNRPLVSSGTLHYQAPDSLTKITAPPAAETMVLQGDILDDTQADGHHYRVVLSQHQEVAGLVEGILATLEGNLATLNWYYQVGYSGGQAGWTLHLVPRQWLVRHKVDAIDIGGAGRWVRSIAVVEPDGDRSDMIITPTGP
jgi:hypothetical protein